MNKKKILDIYTKIYSIFHKIEKRILFISYAGKQFSDSPRVVCEKMHEMFPQYELVWAFENPNAHDVPGYIKKINYKTLEYYKNLATCCAYVTNEDLHKGQFKRKGQFFVQTWHADRPLKKILYEEPEKCYEVTDNLYTDLCIAASDYGERMYRNAFRYTGKILKYGMPRNDILLQNHEHISGLIKKKLGICEKYKVLLYAPTFRDNKMLIDNYKQDINIDIRRVMDILNKKEKWICLVRAHTGVNGFDFRCDGETFIDVTNYDEIADLYLVSNCLITDYSSCATDFILLKRPVVLATFDSENYITNCRNIIDGFFDMGFYIAKNQSELNAYFESFEQLNGTDEYNKVKKFFGIQESGNSAEKICKLLNDEISRKVN